jgi:hypothetical protein
MARIARKAAAALVLSGSLFSLSSFETQAACVPDPAISGTNCSVFTVDTPSDVLDIFDLEQQSQNRYIQMAFFTDALQPVAIQDLSWSRDGGLWTPFTPLNLHADNSGRLAYTSIVDLQAPVGPLLQVRYTIPTAPANPLGTFSQGDAVSSQLFTNSDGFTGPRFDSDQNRNVPVLRRRAGNGFLLEQRDHLDAPNGPEPAAVPGPLPLLGLAASWSTCRQLRRRVRLAAAGARCSASGA